MNWNNQRSKLKIYNSATPISSSINPSFTPTEHDKELVKQSITSLESFAQEFINPSEESELLEKIVNDRILLRSVWNTSSYINYMHATLTNILNQKVNAVIPNLVAEILREHKQQQQPKITAPSKKTLYMPSAGMPPITNVATSAAPLKTSTTGAPTSAPMPVPNPTNPLSSSSSSSTSIPPLPPTGKATAQQLLDSYSIHKDNLLTDKAKIVILTDRILRERLLTTTLQIVNHASTLDRDLNDEFNQKMKEAKANVLKKHVKSSSSATAPTLSRPIANTKTSAPVAPLNTSNSPPPKAPLNKKQRAKQ